MKVSNRLCHIRKKKMIEVERPVYKFVWKVALRSQKPTIAERKGSTMPSAFDTLEKWFNGMDFN